MAQVAPSQHKRPTCHPDRPVCHCARCWLW